MKRLAALALVTMATGAAVSMAAAPASAYDGSDHKHWWYPKDHGYYYEDSRHDGWYHPQDHGKDKGKDHKGHKGHKGHSHDGYHW
ncbi:hypothetical protein [Nocardiopsis sp. LOL_012]|uniref:hypothetical protein n=1 Tax=Nocardiopsis sp. LOL_012 TaxID=3345409 RepID=UPI003A8BC6ED